MASSDGKLVFPIRFDLETAVRQATGDMDRVLRQMQATINSRPLSITPTIDDKGLKEMSEKLKNLDIPQAGIGSGKNRYTAAEGSINALSAAMQKCIKEWNDLAETERITNRETGEYSDQAKTLIERFAALTAASHSFGKTLQQIIADNKRAVAEEEKLAKKRAETAEKLVKLNNPNMSSLTEVKDSLNYFEKLAKSADVFSAGWSICIEKVKTLKEQAKWLTENFKAFSAKDVFNLPEGNLTEIKDKVKALKIQMNAAVPDSAAWDAYAKELSRVKGIQAELEAQQKQSTKTEAQLRAEREASAAALKKVYDEANTEYQRTRSRQKANYDAKKESGIAMKNLLWGDPKTLDEYNAKISALQSKLNTLKPGSERFVKFNTELEKTKKALSDVNEALAQPKIKADKYANLQREVAILQGEERTIDQVNAKLRIRHEWLSKADVGSRSFRRNSEEIARLNKVMDELNAKSREYMRVSIAPMPERSLNDIQAKLEEYHKVMRESDFGSSVYKDAEAAALRLTTKLEKMNKEAAEVEKWRVFQQAIRRSSATIDDLNAKLSAWQTRVNGLKTGTDEWRGAADMVRKYSYELEKTNQLLDNYKTKSLRGLNTNDADARVKQIEAFQKDIRIIDEEMNRMSANGSLFEKDGSVSKAALQNIEERARIEGELNKLTTTGTDLVKQKMEADKRAAEQSVASANKQIEANRQAGLERQRILNAEENNIAAVTAKLQLRQKQLNEAKTGTSRYAKIESEVIRLTSVLNRMQAVQQAELAQMQNELKTVRQLAAALRSYGDTIGQIQTKLSAFQTALNNSKIGGDAFREAALQIKAMNEELSRANQMAQNYQSKAFEGVGKKNTDARVRELEKLQDRIRQIDSQMNLMNVKGQITDKSGGVSAQANKLLEERIRLEEKVQQIMSTGADLAKKKLEEELAAQQKLIDAVAKRTEEYNKRRQQEAEDLAAQQKKAAEEARIKRESIVKEQQANEARKRILNEQRLSYDTLTQKIHMLEAARNKTDIGAKRWQRLTDEINKTRESLKVITDEMDKAARRSERLARLREIMAMSTQSMQGLSARMQEYNSQLQKLEAGTTGFNRLALYIARLSEEYRRVSQYAQDFSQKSMQGLQNWIVDEQVRKLQNLRAELQSIDAEINAHNQMRNSGRGGTMTDDQFKAKLDERIAKQKEINEITKTAEQQALERERQITAEMDKQRKKTEEIKKAQQKRTDQKNLLKSQSKDIDTLTKKLEYYRQLLNRLDPNTKPQTFSQIAKEVQYLTSELQRAQQHINKLTGVSNTSSSRVRTNIKGVTQEYNKQLGYIDRLIRRMMVYGSVGMIGRFLTQVREVTAQFELQKVSLGAILQDQNKANQLFSEIKSFALKSPVSILDLTKYTKQLAAYKIGYDELFETTKKLTDVSVGLGVSMDRVVLAYGQVRATGHLRASEIRQFTEMGVPIVEELAAKLTKMNGELVTAADVMDMVSKRGISFEMVKEVFDDMTSAGGIFYNMQEKQGNTLYGMWAKLGDAASVMYSEIGDTGWVADGMKTLINTVTVLMKNWRLMIGEIAVLVAGFGAYKAATSIATAVTKAHTAAQAKVVAAGKVYNAILAEEKAKRLTATAAERASIAARKANAKAALDAAIAERAAANATGLWSKAMGKLKNALVGNIWTIAITAIAAIAMAIGAAIEKATRLKRALDDIEAETISLQNQSVGRFEYLAEAAVNAANGSRQQRDALEELSRTYGDILPQDALKLENLRQMNHNYAELTTTLKEYIATQQMQKGLNDISETYGGKINKASTNLIDGLVSEMKIGRDVAAQIVGEMQRDYLEKLEKGEKDTRTVTQRMIAAAKKFGVEMSNMQAASAGSPWYDLIWASDEYLVDFYNALGDMSRESSDFENRMKGMAGASYEFQKAIEETKKKIDSTTLVIKNQDGTTSPVDENTMLGQQMKANATMKAVADLIMNDTSIQEAISNKEVEWNAGWIHLVSSVNPNDLMDITRINFDAIIEALNAKHPELANKIKLIQKEWGNVAPTDATMLQINSKLIELTKSFDPTLQKMRQFLWDGAGTVDDYLEKLKDQQERLRALLVEKQNTLLNMTLLDKIKDLLTGHDLEAEIENIKRQIAALDKLVPFVTKYTLPKKSKKTGRGGSRNKTKGGGTTTDNRLQNLQEIHQTLEKINKEYDDLQKREGRTKALEDIQKQFADALAYTNKIGRDFGLHFDYPTDFPTLQQYREEILKVMKSLKKLNGAEKAILEFETMIGKAESDELQKQIEKQLKELSEKISRTKVAKEFYDKILAQTGNEELAVRITYSVYPETGKDLYTEMQDQILRVFDTGDTGMNAKLKLRLDSVFDDENERINYRELDKVYAEFQNDIIEKNRDTAQKIIAEGQKTAAANILTWEKELAKAKDFEEQRTDIIDSETQRRIEIYKSNLSQEEKDRLAQLSRDKQSSELADLNVKEFKGSDDFVKMFEDMGTKATDSLKRMREEIKAVIAADKDMSPENMKEMVDALEKIDEELTGRNPFGDMASGMKGMFGAIKRLKTARAELKAAQSEYKAQEPGLDAEITIAENEKNAADDEKIAAEQQLLDIQRQMAELRTQEVVNVAQLNMLKQQEVIAQNNLVSAEIKSEHANKNLVNAENKKKKAKDKVRKVQKKLTDAEDDAKTEQDKFIKGVREVGECVNSVKSILESLEPIFGDLTSDATSMGNAIEAMVSSISMFESIMTIVIILQEAFNVVSESNPWMAIAAAVLAVTAALAGFIGAEKVRKANEEIERQQDILDELEYTYERLEKAAEKLFGADYIRTYNREVNNLYQQMLAKQKQLAAEETKGKQKDKDQIKSYQEEIRDLEDEIADMRNAVSERMFGTDLTSAARDFASAWLDAYKEFGSTTDAMSEKFNEMIENMVVEGLLAKVMENALKPAFDMIDNMGDGDFYNPEFWRNVVAEAEKATEAGNAGASTMMQFLQAAGLNLRELGGELEGISREVGGATSEEINTWGAALNTQNFYIAQQLSEVRAIRAWLEGGVSQTPDTTAIDYLELQNTALGHLAAIERHTAETVTECRNIAARCEEQASTMRRIVTTQGGASGVNVFVR